MACAVLALSRLGAAGVLLATGLYAVPCSAIPPARQKDAGEFRTRVESGPFYRELVRWAGRPESCDVELDAESIAFSYAFKQSGRLEARVTPGAEATEQRLRLGGLTAKAGLALLKEAERQWFGKDGCGVSWSQPAEESSGGQRQIVYRGDTCNCQGRMVYRNKALVELVFRSAC